MDYIFQVHFIAIFPPTIVSPSTVLLLFFPTKMCIFLTYSKHTECYRNLQFPI